MFSQLYVSGIALRREVPQDSYYAKLPAVRALSKMERLTFTSPVTIFVGENGVGKSTLIEAIAIAAGFNPEGGTANFRFSTKDSHSDLYQYLTVSRGVRRHRDGYFLRAESFYNASTYIDSDPQILQSYGSVPLHELSHGEGFMALVEHRFGGQGLYILDEPEAALSPMRQLELLCYMDELVKKDSQFILSTHSPLLMAYPGAQVLQLSQEGIEAVDYRDTEHYQLTKSFLNAPERMLRTLLGEDDNAD